MTSLGFPTTLAEARDYIELADDAYLHGFTRMTLLRCWRARCHAMGEVMLFGDFLLAVRRGEYDYLIRDASGQSYS